VSRAFKAPLRIGPENADGASRLESNVRQKRGLIMKRAIQSVLIVAATLLAGGEAFAQAVPSLNGQALPTYAAPNNGLLAEIKARGNLINGVEAQNPPFEFIKDGEIVGYDIDVSRLFAEHLGVKLETVDTAWSGVIPSLYTKKFDMIWSAMTITEPRKEAVTFSQPYASDQVEFIVRAGDNSIKTIDDLKGKVLGTQLNSAAEYQAKQLIAEHKLDTQLKSFDHFDGAYLDLKNGNLNVVTSTKLNDKALFEKTPGVFAAALVLPIYNYVGVATRKQDPDLSKEIDAFIKELRSSGKLAELQQKWFGYKMDLPQ
jgi:polar amino acid transport system substrate-binding protein